MRRACLAALAAVALACSTLNVRADTPLDVLGVEKSINDLASRAKETGDYVAQAFATQALNVIAAWKKANADLINQGFDKLDKQSQNLFRELNDTASRLENGEAVTFIDLQRSMVTAGNVLATIPGSSKEPQLVFYWPTILLPTGEPNISIHAIGSRIADANPAVSLAGHMISVNKLSDNEISFDISRASLTKDSNDRKISIFRLEYSVSKSVWYNPFTWWSSETRDREIQVNMLPLVPGTAVISPHLLQETWETMIEGPIGIGGVGKDNTDRYTYTITPVQKEHGWILDKEAQAKDKAHFDDNGGDGDGGSHCVGYDEHSFTDTSLVFLIYHGHKTDMFGHQSSAHQNCRMWLHLKRMIKQESDGDKITRSLNWQQDVDIALPDNSISYSVALTLYNGRSYKIADDKQIPYGLFEVFRNAKEVTFRPRPQRDF